MRLLFFSESFFPAERGGAGRAAGDVCRELHRRGHVIDVLCPSAALAIERHEIAPGFTLHNLPAGDGPLSKQIVYAYSRRMALEALEYVQRQVPLDAVEAYHDNGGFFHALYTLQMPLLDALPNARSLVQFQIQYRPLLDTETHIPPEAQRLIDQQRELAKRADITAFLSHAERDEGVRAFGLDAGDTVKIVPNAIPMERYAGLGSFVPLWDMPRPPCVALAGRLGSPMKGLDLALKALAIVAERLPFNVLLIGHQPQPHEVPPALEGRIRATGWLDARGVAEALHGCAAFLMPSRYEPFGLLALEAQAVMCPVVAMDTGGLRDIIRGGETGLLCAPDRAVDDLARHTATLLRDNDLREDLAIAAHARLLAHFTVPAICDQLEAIYRG
jgi:glycosyltransferase involved in cell wall biosynthesis